MKDFQAAGEAFSPPKRTSSSSKQEISSLFPFYVGHFVLLDPDPDPGLIAYYYLHILGTVPESSSRCRSSSGKQSNLGFNRTANGPAQVGTYYLVLKLSRYRTVHSR